MLTRVEPTKELVLKALQALGNNADEVRKALVADGSKAMLIRGTNRYRCPVQVYLEKRFTGSLYVYRNVSRNADSTGVICPVPRPVRAFGEKFDQRDYYELHHDPAPSDGAKLIAQERHRQIHAKGYDEANDDVYLNGELALAAIAYASPVPVFVATKGEPLAARLKDLEDLEDPWPWPAATDKRKHVRVNGVQQPRDPRSLTDKECIRFLVKAGALIAAEIDRRQRRIDNPGDPTE